MGQITNFGELGIDDSYALFTTNVQSKRFFVVNRTGVSALIANAGDYTKYQELGHGEQIELKGNPVQYAAKRKSGSAEVLLRLTIEA